MTKDRSSGQEEISRKKVYHKPACEVIELVTGEVLAVGCKFVGGDGQLGFCHIINPCPIEGS